MRLSWSKQAEISAALCEAYPDVDRLSLSHDHLLHLIWALPDFEDTPNPPKLACLDHILWTWMRLADDESRERYRV